MPFGSEPRLRMFCPRTTVKNRVQHAKAFGRGYGALEQIYRWAAAGFWERRGFGYRGCLKSVGKGGDLFANAQHRLSELGVRFSELWVCREQTQRPPSFR
jgi:hypothetical protein